MPVILGPVVASRWRVEAREADVRTGAIWAGWRLLAGVDRSERLDDANDKTLLQWRGGRL